MCTVCVRCLVTCMPQWARKGKYGREVSSSAPKCSKVSPSGMENKDRSHRSLKPVLLLFLKILLNLRKPSKPSFRPPFQTLDPIFAQQVAILLTRPDRSSVRSGSQRNIRIGPNDPDICAVSRGICPGIQRKYPGHKPNFCISSGGGGLRGGLTRDGYTTCSCSFSPRGAQKSKFSKLMFVIR